MNQKLEGQIRHILTLVAGFLGALGLIPNELIADGQEVLMVVVGAVFAVIAFVRSYITKQSDEDVEKIATKVAEKLDTKHLRA